ncbi:MAG TPA: flagellar filament capping protein FliD [Telluria sp.]
MAISSSGIGSGLPVNDLVTQLMNAERIPYNLLKAKETSFNARLSSFGTLKSAVSTFQTALKALTAENLGKVSATSAKPELLGVTAGASAAAGTYSIKVLELAQSHKLVSAGDTDSAALLGSGTMSIQVGANTAVTIPAGDYSLKTLSEAINKANAGVNATIVNDGTTNKLVISSTASGTANTVSITAGGGLAKFASMTELQPPRDAQLDIDGILVTKSSNTVTDAIAGVTLNLLKVDASAVGVTIATDKPAVKTSITAFVEAYNTLAKKIKEMTAYDPATKKSGPLNGEQGASGILMTLRGELSKAVTGGGMTGLADIGLSFNRDGTLAADDKKLQAALDGKFRDVAALFTSADGLATRLDKSVTGILGAKGVIANRTEGIQKTIKSLVINEEAKEVQLAATEKRLRAQFVALDTMMSKMQTTSSYLTQQLASMSYNYE